MATPWVPDTFKSTPFGWGDPGPQYTVSPSGTMFQMLTGGQYRAPDGSIIGNPSDWERRESERSSMLSGLMGGGSAPAANPYGASVPTVNNSNRFEAGLSDTESRLRALLDNPDSVQQSAAYKFRVGQGQEALQRSMGAKGMLNSGNRLMELTKYGQDMASQEYGAQAGRLGDLLTNYSGSWIGDKNANTSRYAAESGAWNTAQSNADRNKYQMASLAWEMSKPQSNSSSGSRSQTNLSSIGGSSNLGAIGGSTDWNDPAFARMRQARIDAGNY